MRDSIEFEWGGRHSVAIITEEFVPGAQTMQRVSRMQNYPFVVADNRIGKIEDDALLKRIAFDLVPDVVRCLVDRPLPVVTENQNE